MKDIRAAKVTYHMIGKAFLNTEVGLPVAIGIVAGKFYEVTCRNEHQASLLVKIFLNIGKFQLNFHRNNLTEVNILIHSCPLDMTPQIIRDVLTPCVGSETSALIRNHVVFKDNDSGTLMYSDI